MDRRSTTFDETMQHPPHEGFLLFVDGEIDPREAARWSSHLDACWPCRVRVGKIGETIAEIIDFEETVGTFALSKDNRSWGDFDSRLREIATEPLDERSGSIFGSIRKRLERLSTFQRGWVYASPIFAAALIAVILIQFVFVTPITAADVLANVITADGRRVSEWAEPVTYRKLRISADERSEMVEIWNDVQSERTRSTATSRSVAGELAAALAASGYPADRLLSASAYREWANRFPGRTENVADVTLPNGASVYEIATQIPMATDAAGLAAVGMTVRRSDWHATGQTFTIAGPAGTWQYSVVEEDFKILGRNELQARFFDQAPEIQAMKPATSSPDILPGPADEPVSGVETEAPATVEAPKLADMEVTVLAALSSIGADLGDEISVRREGGRLVVVGLVETTKRKSEVLAALGGLRLGPSLRIEVETVAEALAKRGNKAPAGTVTLEDLETRSLSTASDNELVRHFGGEAEARAFAARVVSRSGEAMSHVYALRRLSRQFSTAEVREMSAAARSKWASLIQSHARAFRNSRGDVGRELSSVFGGNASPAGTSGEITDVDELVRTVERLLAEAASGDRAIRAALTVSAGDREFSSLRNAQFWQSMRNADSLAARIATFK